jgi:sigma-B regulation protein RsbU (phosphoserine phosphatase)
MAGVENSQGLLGGYLDLFAHTEIFVFVFMEIVTKLDTIQRVIFKKATKTDYIAFVIIFGLFSIFGTYIGIPNDFGLNMNIRDIAPIVAGLVAGPVVGLAVGLIGGIHRFFLGGITGIPCSLATVMAGLLAGLVYRWNKETLLGIVPAMLFAITIELLHIGLVLVLSPFAEMMETLFPTFPQMIIAVSLGVGISIIIVHSRLEYGIPAHMESRERSPDD